jgi:branched-chain amino acid transport system ATP-binding protein
VTESPSQKNLVVEHVEVFYGEFQALFGVNLEIEQGETVAIIGANGAGKTTLMRTVCGLLSPHEGRIVYQGEVISGQSPYVLTRKGIAMVPEERKIFPSLTVEENLKIGAYSQRKGLWDVDKVYELFPILKDRARYGGTDLSGGQQQMLAIGRALMSNPDLLLMDEISLGLAPIIVKELYNVVKQIADTGTTVVLVEQDVSQGMKAANRVYCLLEGKVSLSGKPSEINMQDVSRAYFGV